MMKKPYYLLVDDDTTSNLICELNIRKLDPGAEILCFNEPEVALASLEDVCAPRMDSICILFLDVNMPTMTGWEFLDEFRKACPDMQKKFMVYILSSSIEDFSNEKKKYGCVKGFLSKPLLREKLLKIMEEVTGVINERVNV